MIELITTSLFVLHAVYGNPTAAIEDSTSTAPGASVRAEEQSTTSIPTSKEIERRARIYFKDDPILVEVARCESSFRQIDENGKVLIGIVNKGDIGLMQINKYYHADKAKSLGLDLNTLEGNMAYAKYLYNKEGLQPWISSSKCWNKTISGNQVALNK